MKQQFILAESVTSDLLSKVPKLCFTVDTGTSPFKDDFFGITVHWINEEWQQREIRIGFERLKGPHTAENLKEIFISVLDRFNITRKLFTITSDNASNMLKMMDLIEEYAIQKGCVRITAGKKRNDVLSHTSVFICSLPFRAKTHHIPCIGHVFNLAVQEILNKGMNAEAPDENDIDDSLPKTANQRINPIVKLRKGIIKMR